MATQWYVYPLNDEANSTISEGLTACGHTVSTALIRDKEHNPYTAFLVPGSFIKHILKHQTLNKECWIFCRERNYGTVHRWIPQKRISQKAKAMKKKAEQLKKEKSA